jgi:hypothetical protein
MCGLPDLQGAFLKNNEYENSTHKKELKQNTETRVLKYCSSKSLLCRMKYTENSSCNGLVYKHISCSYSHLYTTYGTCSHYGKESCKRGLLPDVPVSGGQSPDSDSCPGRKSVPGFL